MRALIAASALLAMLNLPAWAQEILLPPLQPQVLTYDILMDGKKIGTETVTISPAGEDTRVSVVNKTDVTVLFFRVTYDHARDEIWRGGRLQSLKATTNDDGDAHSVNVERGTQGFKVAADGETRELAADALPLSLWHEMITQASMLYGVIDAAPYDVETERLGDEKVSLRGQDVTAKRYKMNGDALRDLWYGPDGILLKTQFKRRGYNIEYALQ